MAASSCATEPERSALAALDAWGWAPAGTERPLLDGVTLRLWPGECALLTGATGSGKSTLLRGLAGLLPPGGSVRGERRVRGRAALLFQNVDTQLLFSTVEEEVGSGLRGAAVAAPREVRVREALARVELGGFERRPVEDLSAGERQRVVLASLLAGEPSLLLLDEPTSALDPASRLRLAEVLAELKARGHGLLIAEHAPEPFRSLADRWLVLEDGRVSPAAALPARARRLRSSALPAVPGPARVRCRGVAVRDPEGRVRLPALDLELRSGESVLVCGVNGSGKSTLLQVLAGVAAPSEGRVERAEGPDCVGPGRVALVLQNPPRNLFAPSVAEEVGFTLERRGAHPARVEARVLELLDACGMRSLREASPLRLSFGQQHCVAIAAALASEPALLLLDEPFAGLDAQLRRRLLDLIDRERARTGMAVVIASHDPGELEGWAQRQIALAPPPPEPREAGMSRAAAAPPGLAAAAGRAFHYRDTGSLLHRLGVGWKLLGVSVGGAAAIAASTPPGLAALLAAWLMAYRLAGLRAPELWQDTRWLLAQGVVVVALSWLRDGAGGAADGLRAAAQIALFFLPGALLLRTTPTGRLLAGVRRVLPAQLAFALATSLRFVPFFSRELHEMLAVQRLRGARLSARDAWRPGAWRDAVACVGVPLAVRVIHTANEVALAAEARGVAARLEEAEEA
jgi:energy-coupling factor transporter ATP-binding protein EcfA2/energy-coupling factor transporter transmembrane protein EcfT